MNKHKYHREQSKRSQLPKRRLIIGRKPLLEALAQGNSIEKIFILKTATGPELNEIKTLAKDSNIAVSMVPMEKLNKFTRVNHQGVIAIAGLIPYFRLQEVIDQVVGQGLSPLFVVLDGVTDTRNLGAIARSAYCFGAQGIVLPSSNSAAITEESIKTSAGALEHIAICKETSIEQIMDILRLNGIQTWAMDIQGQPLHESQEADAPLALIMGAEGKGISPYVIKTADRLVRIPQSRQFDSLNVSVAAGVILYEVFKSRL